MVMRLIGCTAVARRLGVTLERVRQLHGEGHLPAVHVTLTGARFYDPQVVERLARARERRQQTRRAKAAVA